MFRFTIYFTESGTTTKKSQLAFSRSNAFSVNLLNGLKPRICFMYQMSQMSYLSFEEVL